MCFLALATNIQLVSTFDVGNAFDANFSRATEAPPLITLGLKLNASLCQEAKSSQYPAADALI